MSVMGRTPCSATNSLFFLLFLFLTILILLQCAQGSVDRAFLSYSRTQPRLPSLHLPSREKPSSSLVPSGQRQRRYTNDMSYHGVDQVLSGESSGLSIYLIFYGTSWTQEDSDEWTTFLSGMVPFSLDHLRRLTLSFALLLTRQILQIAPTQLFSRIIRTTEAVQLRLLSI